MDDPIREFTKYCFRDKTAAPAWMSSPMAKTLGTAAGVAVAAPLAGAAIGGLGDAAKGIYNAVTKKRDFNAMLEFNQDLRGMHKQDPKIVNAAFSTLRRINPQYSRDPLVAGAFVRNLSMAPEGAFQSANMAQTKAPPSMMEQGYMGNIGAGVHAGMGHAMDESPQSEDSRKLEFERKKLIMGQLARGMKEQEGVRDIPAPHGLPGTIKERYKEVGLSPEARKGIAAVRGLRF